MERRFFLKILAASIAATNVYRIPQLHAQTAGSQNLVLPLKLNLAGAGRLGFYIDYSELITVGTHTFYAIRTHGSQGAVGCKWTAYDSADGTQLATGSLSWANESIDVLSFTVDVASKPAGDHRVYVLLSAPTGGAVLHHGNSTVAYGIIDDDTIATSNAIFIDADAVTDGVGTQASPYNNWYSARDALLVTDRYMYIKGLMRPDATDRDAPSARVNNAKHFGLKTTFDGRENEAQRLIIRNWPAFTGGITGNGDTNTAGFLLDGASIYTDAIKYVTFKNLSVLNLGGDAGVQCFAIRTKGGASDLIEHITAENIIVDGVVSGQNSAIAVWYSEAGSNFKMWRWDVKNTSYLPVTGAGPLHSFQCYRTDNVSIQRCTFHPTGGGAYEKEGFAGEVRVGMSLRFNLFDGPQVQFSTQGGIQSQDFQILQNNIFSNTIINSFSTLMLFTMSSTQTLSSKQLVSNNVFYNYTDFAIAVNRSGWEGFMIYNNIFHEVVKGWRFSEGVSAPEYIDYNLYQNETRAPDIEFFLFGPNSIPNLQGVHDISDFEANSITSNPRFTNAEAGEFKLMGGSPALNQGVDGTNMGVYLSGIEIIGADNSLYSPPAKMDSPDVTIIG
jgi:hypothetical protein